MEAFESYAPTMLGGAADLVESTKTTFDGAGVFARTTRGATSPSAFASMRWARS